MFKVKRPMFWPLTLTVELRTWNKDIYYKIWYRKGNIREIAWTSDILQNGLVWIVFIIVWYDLYYLDLSFNIYGLQYENSEFNTL